MNTKSLPQRVWETLSTIDVTPYVEYMKATGKRPAMRYLPWHKAWALTKEHFPNVYYEHQPDVTHPNNTMEVEVSVYFPGDGETGYNVTCRLGVMDNNYRAIVDPDARAINDGRQRALVKALAFAGLGLNLWSDSDVPVGYQDKPINAEQLEELLQLMKKSKSDTEKFLKWAQVDTLDALPMERWPLAKRTLLEKIKLNDG